MLLPFLCETGTEILVWVNSDIQIEIYRQKNKPRNLN